MKILLIFTLLFLLSISLVNGYSYIDLTTSGGCGEEDCKPSFHIKQIPSTSYVHVKSGEVKDLGTLNNYMNGVIYGYVGSETNFNITNSFTSNQYKMVIEKNNSLININDIVFTIYSKYEQITFFLRYKQGDQIDINNDDIKDIDISFDNLYPDGKIKLSIIDLTNYDSGIIGDIAILEQELPSLRKIIFFKWSLIIIIIIVIILNMLLLLQPDI